MNHTIIMSKYQGLGNDYLILDPKKNKVELQGKKVAHFAGVGQVEKLKVRLLMLIH